MKRKITPKALFAGLLVVLLISSGAFALNGIQDDEPDTPAASDVSTTGETAATETSTEDEKQASEEHKQELVDQMNAEKSQSSGKKQVTPVITNISQSGSQVSVYSYVSGIFEDGGSCTYTFTKAGVKFTKQVQAFANASTTDCQPLAFDKSEFPSSGEWEVINTYDSSKASGVSQAKRWTVN